MVARVWISDLFLYCSELETTLARLFVLVL